MGIIFGMTGTKEPVYKLIDTSASYEIRLYQPYFIAEVKSAIDSGSGKSDMSSSFQTLAKYIGVFGTPENLKSQSIAMTAPVIMKPEKIAMTSPVITESNEEVMQFVLPSEYISLEQIPIPSDKRVVIKSIPSKLIAATRFSGSYNKDFFDKKLRELYEHVLADSLEPDFDHDQTPVDKADITTLKWSAAQYHPPFTIPFMRRNEVWIELRRANYPKLSTLLDGCENEEKDKK
jgi:hypothetical protein